MVSMSTRELEVRDNGNTVTFVGGETEFDFVKEDLETELFGYLQTYLVTINTTCGVAVEFYQLTDDEFDYEVTYDGNTYYLLSETLKDIFPRD